MSSSYGEKIRISIFGQSHSAGIGVNIEGLPAGEPIDMDELSSFLARRAPGKSDISTPRSEADLPEFLSGLVDDTTCGAPLCAIIRNTNTRSGDYKGLEVTPRPGHADYTAQIKYGGFQDVAGGGHFSGRLTAPLCIAGGICLQLLRREGIEIISRVASIGAVEDKLPLTPNVIPGDIPTMSLAASEAMREEILAAKSRGDSVGGVIECAVLGVPAGLGDPMFGGMENRLAAILFGIPAVKGVEFGAGFRAATMYGSQNNDPFTVENGKVVTATNNSGGILGGITNGMPITFRAAVKPTPSIAIEQDTVELNSGEPAKLRVHGRHDPCIVPRAVPCMEAAAAIAVYDALLGYKKYMR